MVIAPVSSSSTSMPLDVVLLRITNVELHYSITYACRDQTFLIEPGRYRLAGVQVGSLYSPIQSEPFEVRSGRITVLPTLRFFQERAEYYVQLDAEPSVTREEFRAIFPDHPWKDRPGRAWSWFGPLHASHLAQVSPRPYAGIYGHMSSGGSHDRMDRPRNPSSQRNPAPRSPR
jgi:hypothetical protein